MSVGKIRFSDKTYTVGLLWPVGVAETIIYARARGEEKLSDERLLELRAAGRIDQVNGFAARVGMDKTAYTIIEERLQARWVDIYYCDLDAEGAVVEHAFAQSAFNGECRVEYSILTMPVAAGYNAVRISVENKSRFTIEEGGIGYSVGRRDFEIPFALKPGMLRELPQFEAPQDETVRMCRFEDKYPAVFTEMCR